MIESFEKNSKRHAFFHDQNSILKSQNRKKESKNYKIKVTKKQKFSKNILFFVFLWVFAFVHKNLYLYNLPLEKLSNFQIEKTNLLKKREQDDSSQKNLFLIKQKNKQKTSFFYLKKVYFQSFDSKIKYSKIYVLNSLTVFKNSVQFFDSFFNFISMNSSEYYNHFQMIYHQYLKFHFFNVQIQFQKNQFLFGNFVSFQRFQHHFFCFSEKKLCFFSGLAFLHLIPQNFQKPFGFFTEHNLQIFKEKNSIKFFSFFFTFVQREKKRVTNFTFLKTSDFEKSFFHLCLFFDAKKLKKTFLSTFVFLFKKHCFTIQKFSFINSNLENSLEKPIFLFFKRYFYNFFLFNSTLLFFFKNPYSLKKILTLLKNFLFLKNLWCSIFLKKYPEQKEIFQKKFFCFFPQPFSQRIIQTQKKKKIFFMLEIFFG